MSKITWRGGALLAPMPAVLVSCGTIEKPNVMTLMNIAMLIKITVG